MFKGSLLFSSLITSMTLVVNIDKTVSAAPTPDPFTFRDPYRSAQTQSPSALSPAQPVTLSGELESWRARAQKWYTHHDLKQRRSQMREMSRPLKRSCYYCHTKSFKGYVEERYLISLQMMAISAEQDVSCAECHLGRRGLTELGAKSLVQWRFAQREGLDCRDCHLENGRFRTLTERGRQALPELITTLKKSGETHGINSEVITQWIQRLQSVKLSKKSAHLPSPSNRIKSSDIKENRSAERP